MAIGRPITLTNNVASKSVTIVASADQTSFTPTGGYLINQIAVYRNGVRLVDGRDFTARDGATVTLTSGCTVDDVVEFQIFEDFAVADAIGAAESEQTINGDLSIVGTLSPTQINATGVVTASAFVGSGAELTGVSGFGTAINDTVNTLGNLVYKTPRSFRIATGSSILLESDATSGNMLYTRLGEIAVSSGSTMVVGSGTTLCMDVLDIFSVHQH